MVAPKPVTIASFRTNHDTAVSDPSDYLFNTVPEDRLIGNGNQLFGSGIGDAAKAGAFTTGENQRFHGSTRRINSRSSQTCERSLVGVQIIY